MAEYALQADACGKTTTIVVSLLFISLVIAARYGTLMRLKMIYLPALICLLVMLASYRLVGHALVARLRLMA